MKPRDSQFSTLRFIFIAVVLMLLADTFLFGGKRSYIEQAKQSRQIAAPVDAGPSADPDREDGLRPRHEDDAPSRVVPDNGAYFESVPEDTEPENAPDDGQAALPPVVGPGPFEGKAKVAIIIDDLGMDVRRSRAIVALPAPITLAFLPYGTKTQELAALGRERGHELIIHTPMQAVDTAQNIGPMGLKANMDAQTFDESFKTILQSFEGYDGINNHMGSLLTQDETAMTRLMHHLKAHNLFFVDSRTISTSVAAREAREAGVPYAVRDVFLDHEATPSFVAKALLQLERKALKDGSAIAIGHPKDATIAGLQAWLPTLAAKGIEVVPVKELLIRPATMPVNIPVVSSRPERGETEETPNEDKAGDPSRASRITKPEIATKPEISPDVLRAFDDGLAAPVPRPQTPQTQLPAIY